MYIYIYIYECGEKGTENKRRGPLDRIPSNIPSLSLSLSLSLSYPNSFYLSRSLSISLYTVIYIWEGAKYVRTGNSLARLS